MDSVRNVHVRLNSHKNLQAGDASGALRVASARCGTSRQRCRRQLPYERLRPLLGVRGLPWDSGLLRLSAAEFRDLVAPAAAAAGPAAATDGRDRSRPVSGLRADGRPPRHNPGERPDPGSGFSTFSWTCCRDSARINTGRRMRSSGPCSTHSAHRSCCGIGVHEREMCNDVQRGPG